MSGPAESIVYVPEDRVFPAPDDDDLWRSVYSVLRADYPDRVLPEHARWAFEAVCAEQDEYMLFKDFLRKVRLKWLWKRPPAPRGMTSLD